MKRVAIIGGGPIGVEAALYGAVAGFDVRLFERGQIADNVRRWGFVQVFTEWGRNRSPLAQRLLRELDETLAPDDEYSSGAELANYVTRLSQLAPLKDRIVTGTEVVAITRERCLRSDFINNPQRAELPFRVVLRSTGNEWVENFDAVIDASGSYTSPNWVGSGGAPCPGEIFCSPKQIDYALPDVAGSEKLRFANRHTLVVGSGHSAASTLLAVADLMEEFPQTRLTWVVRRNVPPHGAPYTIVENETSTTRARLHRRANALVEHPSVTFLPRTVVDAIGQDENGFTLRLQSAVGDELVNRDIRVDNIAAHTGFRADTTLWQELQIKTHPATGAPWRLGEELNAHNARSGVGLSTGYAEKQPIEEEGEKARDRWQMLINDPELLDTGEPNFYVIGMKSYGRDAGFLMHNGFRQVRDVYRLLSGNLELDLYDGALG